MALVTCAECRREVSSEAKSCPQCGSPVKRADKGGGKYVVLAVFLALGSCVVANMASDGTVPGSVEVTSRDELATLQGVATLAGFECPAAKLGTFYGQSEYGPRFVIHCGPAGRDGVYEDQHYVVYPQRLIARVCSGAGGLNCR